MEFSKYISMAIPEGDVKTITNSNGIVLWEKPTPFLVAAPFLDGFIQYAASWRNWINQDSVKDLFEIRPDGFICSKTEPDTFLVAAYDSHIFANEVNAIQLITDPDTTAYATTTYKITSEAHGDYDVRISWDNHLNDKGNYSIINRSKNNVVIDTQYLKDTGVATVITDLYHDSDKFNPGTNTIAVVPFETAEDVFVPEISIDIRKLKPVESVSVNSSNIIAKVTEYDTIIQWSSAVTGESGSVITHDQSGGFIDIEVPSVQYDTITLQVIKEGCLASDTYTVDI